MQSRRHTQPHVHALTKLSFYPVLLWIHRLIAVRLYRILLTEAGTHPDKAALGCRSQLWQIRQ